MIFPSTSAMVILDVIIVAGIAVMLIVSWRLGMFRPGREPRTGSILIIMGAVLTGLFYVADFLSMTVLPALTGEPAAMETMQHLHLEVRWPVSLVSLALIGSGVVLGAYHRRRGEQQMLEAEAQITAANERMIESEIRFRALVEQTPDSVYCYEFRPPVPVELSVEKQIERSYDAVLVECNEVFATACEFESTAAAIGTRFSELDSSKHTTSHAQFFRDFVESGYRLVDYELKYEGPAGDPRALQISLSGVVHNGQLVRFWGAEKDILESSRTKAILAGRMHFQKFAAELSSRLLTAADEEADSVLQKCIEEVARYARAERGKISCIDEGNEYRFGTYFWSRFGEAPFPQATTDQYPEIWRRLQLGEPFAISDIPVFKAQFPIDGKTLAAFGLQSIAFVPLTIGEQYLGSAVFSNIRAHQSWSKQDLTDIQVLCNLMGNKLVQVEARQSLQKALAELRVAKSRLEAENTYLREEIESTTGFDELIGESDSLMRCLRQVERVAGTTTPVLLQGETGTGKELIAHAIHNRSTRSDKPLVKVNCAALPANLIESELFGHEKGAFTGAVSRKQGRFEMADGGTLFLDEVGELPIELQSKLLRVLQSGEFERLGGEQTLQTDARIIAATNRNLAEAVEHGEFRPDLFYRIGAFPIMLPPLRDRRGDIALLAEHFVRKHADNLGKEVTAISASMLEQLHRHSWPGNVRELEGIIQRALISATGPVLELAQPLHSDFIVPEPSSNDSFIGATDLRSVEREHITRVLQQTDWVVGGDTGAANILGLPASTLRSKMKKLGIGRPN